MLEPNFSPFPEIQTNRLLLRRIVKTDAPEILSLRSDDTVMQYIDREKAKTLEDAEAFIQLINEALDTSNGLTWAITLLDQPETLIGTIGFWRLIKQHYRAEVGYMLAPAYWRNGIMKEALLAVIDFGFTHIKLHSIEAHINPANTASASILVSAGFIREAYFKEDYYFRGDFIDTAIYSLLAK
jgi:ribosomal-protein-alanine N-acetyltransferase